MYGCHAHGAPEARIRWRRGFGKVGDIYGGQNAHYRENRYGPRRPPHRRSWASCPCPGDHGARIAKEAARRPCSRRFRRAPPGSRSLRHNRPRRRLPCGRAATMNTRGSRIRDELFAVRASNKRHRTPLIQTRGIHMDSTPASLLHRIMRPTMAKITQAITMARGVLIEPCRTSVPTWLSHTVVPVFLSWL